MVGKAQKNRTFGISLNPELKDRAEARALALGLTLSRYTSLCLEAELGGLAQILREEAGDMERLLRRAREYWEVKTRSLEFEAAVAGVLDRSGVRYERRARVEGLRCDFVLRQASTVREGDYLIVIECRSDLERQPAATLGQSILLRSLELVNAVLVVVPFMEGFDPHVLEQFRRQDIRVTTPDGLREAFEETVMDLQTADLARRRAEDS